MRVRAALLLTVLAAPCGSEEAAVQFQGRLFTTPAERRMLDRLREGAHDETTSQTPLPTVPEPVPPAEPLRIDGMVVRSGGPDTVWVDGEPVTLEGATSRDIRIEHGADASGGVTLRVSEQSQGVHLKPGQRYDRATGRVTEAFPIMSRPQGPGAEGP